VTLGECSRCYDRVGIGFCGDIEQRLLPDWSQKRPQKGDDIWIESWRTWRDNQQGKALKNEIAYLKQYLVLSITCNNIEWGTSLSSREHIYPERELKNSGWCLSHKSPGIGSRASHIIRKPSTIELYLHFLLCFFFFFAAVGFELRASCLLGRHCTAWATPPSLLFLETRSCYVAQAGIEFLVLLLQPLK
jgi:hypothetical protein